MTSTYWTPPAATLSPIRGAITLDEVQREPEVLRDTVCVQTLLTETRRRIAPADIHDPTTSPGPEPESVA